MNYKNAVTNRMFAYVANPFVAWAVVVLSMATPLGLVLLWLAVR